MQDFELTAKRSKIASKKLAYKYKQDIATLEHCENLENVEVTLLLTKVAIEYIERHRRRTAIPEQDQILFTKIPDPVGTSQDIALSLIGQKRYLVKTLQWIFKQFFDPERPSNLEISN